LGLDVSGQTQGTPSRGCFGAVALVAVLILALLDCTWDLMF
jgi:hypothetical protein